MATDSRASAGHSLNQSMVQQLTREGNCLKRARKISPMGLREKDPHEAQNTDLGIQDSEPVYRPVAQQPDQPSSLV